MILLKFSFYLIPLFVNTGDTSKKVVYIIGQAYNDKDGAWVMSKNHINYYVTGIEYWDVKTEDKTVKVWGRILTEKLISTPRKPGEPIPQEMVGTKRTILNAKWKLLR